MAKLEYWQLKQRQSQPLDIKIKLSKIRIQEWYEYYDGKVYVAFSGGKDSTVLLHLVRSLYPDIPAVFVDTGLEYPEVRDFVKNTKNVIWLKPNINFKQVLEKYGYPVISKMQARFISDVQNKNEKNKATTNLRLTGYNRFGVYCPSMKISNKWLYLIDSDIKISEKCCNVMKKQPFSKFEKDTKRKPFVAIMADESKNREKSYLQKGCNLYSKNKPLSTPIAFWVEADIWEYLKMFNVSYCKIYDMGEKRTGCMFCMFGVHLEKGENRFQRMKKAHPKQYEYCINTLGCGKVLDLIKVKY